MTEKRAEYIVDKAIGYLKVLRKKKGLSHQVLADLAGVTRAAISHIESGKRRPSLKLSIRLADALGADFPQLLNSIEKEWNRRSDKP